MSAWLPQVSKSHWEAHHVMRSWVSSEPLSLVYKSKKTKSTFFKANTTHSWNVSWVTLPRCLTMNPNSPWLVITIRELPQLPDRRPICQLKYDKVFCLVDLFDIQWPMMLECDCLVSWQTVFGNIPRSRDKWHFQADKEREKERKKKPILPYIMRLTIGTFDRVKGEDLFGIISILRKAQT